MKYKRKIYLYIFIVILPVFLFGSFYFKKILKDDEIKRKKDAKWIGTIYQQNWGQFITETVTSMKILSYSAEENLVELQSVQPLLQKVNQSDPRYGGIYLLDSHGHYLIGSRPNKQAVDFSKLDYIQEVIKTVDTVTSSNIDTLKNKQQILGIATPVLNENHQLDAILVANLRIDYMKNLMMVLTPDTKLYVVNGVGNSILNLNVEDKELENSNDWVNVPMDRLPWTIKIKLSPSNYQDIVKSLGKVIFIILVISHILFLLIEYTLLRRQALKEKKENEVQKLELVGTLAASTAHEIRNPLTGVKGLLQLLSEKYTESEDRYYFEVIDSELKRINEIVSEFLILGKPTAQLMVNIDIAEVLEELKPLIISEGTSHNVKCVWKIPSDSVVVHCVKDQLKQVILNISKNAFESMENGGLLQINLEARQNDCKLEIIDNGKGIAKENSEKIFQPFFTSKETGTGLGLVICQRIITSFHGHIQIKSTKSVGTTAEISLPIVKTKRA